MSISIISFTQRGMQLSQRLIGTLGGDRVFVYTKCKACKNAGSACRITYVEESIEEWAKEHMKKKQALLFIGACGIAVRAIAPHIKDKLQDSPILVMDETGAYVIPILSGHMGGANEIALQIARSTNAIPVITTATDLNHKFAVDLFAKKNGFQIVNKDGIAKVSSKVLAGEKITMSVEDGHLGEETNVPEEITIVGYPPKQITDIVIASDVDSRGGLLRLKPREYIVGMGCRSGKKAGEIERFIQFHLDASGISREQIWAMASIDRKKDEEGLLAWCREANVLFLTYSAEQLDEVEGQFRSSAFVKQQVGVDNVCERAALRACGPGGRLVLVKQAKEGMTIAIAKRKWRVAFDEE